MPETDTSTEEQVQNVSEQATTTNLPGLSDDQLTEIFKYRFGYEGDINSIKTKLEYTPPPPPPTDEDKVKAQQAEEKRLLDIALENGVTVDQYAYMKSILSTDDKELSKNAAIKELVDAGLTREQAEQEVKNRYYQIELESLERDEDNDETEEEFAARKKELQKKIDFGKAKLAAKSRNIKEQAERFFTTLKDTIKSKDSEVEREATYSSKVEEHFSKLPREITLEMGEVNGQKISPIAYQVSDDIVSQSKELLTDPAKRKQFFFTDEGSLNIENISRLLVEHHALQHAAKLSFLEGQHRNTQEFEKVFPARTAYQVGVGGAGEKSGKKGEIAGSRAPRPVNSRQLQQ